MLQVTDELLQEMTDIIVKEVQPRKVILFGSHARGEAGPDSDLDFLVVEDGPFGLNRSRRAEMVKLLRSVRNFRIATDFLVYTSEEIDKWQSSRNHVVSHALREGKVLYERR